MRQLKFSDAVAEATCLAMERDPKLFILGEGVDDPKGSFGTTLLPFQRFGKDRVLDMPLSENAMTGIAIGAAIAGHRCLMVHLRSEFLLLAMDQIVNHAAKWHYMFGDRFNVPLTIRCVIGRGWGQAAQHSQSFHGLFAAIPGLKVVLPSTAYDAKGLLISALEDPNPVLFIEHRWLHGKSNGVPEEYYKEPIGKARILAQGRDVTCVAVSHSVHDAITARAHLLKEGIDMEVIDLRSARPLDRSTILESIARTGHLIVTDIASPQCGIASEIAALAASEGFSSLRAPVKRITLPDLPTPCSTVLESAYYPGPEALILAARSIVSQKVSVTYREKSPLDFFGPF